jgi:hypothetical protein
MTDQYQPVVLYLYCNLCFVRERNSRYQTITMLEAQLLLWRQYGTSYRNVEIELQTGQVLCTKKHGARTGALLRGMHEF